MQKSLKVSIVSRNEIEREGLRQILADKGFAVSGIYRDHLDLDLDQVVSEENVTSLVLVNSATEEESIEACRFVHDHWPACKLVIFASNLQGQAVFDAFRAGIDGYVGKQVSVDSLEQILKLVALGEKVIPSQTFFELPAARAYTDLDEPNVSLGDAKLSDREIDILKGLIRGDPNKVISRHMAITEATVKVHVKSILRKVSVVNRTQAAIWGLSRGIVHTGAAGMNGSGKPIHSCQPMMG